MWPFDNNNQQAYQQYAQAYNTGNYNGFDSGQTLGHLNQFIQGAPADLQQSLFQQHFDQMPYEHRALLAQQMPPQYGIDPNNSWSMAQGLMRLGREQPQLLQRVFSHPVLLGSAAVLTGLIAKHMIDNHRREEYREDRQEYANNGYQQQYGGYQQPYGNQGYIQQELNEERREEKELRRELRQEERELERFEEGEHRHHHRREDY
ncbi:hypothetical protein [Dictyobacter arantiisoli]|uniref:Uncharacterized protein n=1 Tax=Dictyobacter arantiisoli TaxID=2014874 RepID=A0A5A5T5G9_9CHLR|nr:hypothetical protein [Dictyobacter arantiisoli]GCF06660.1 hypothetical protein KDI_02240 [Dictyobacter arantiisoli]